MSGLDVTERFEKEFAKWQKKNMPSDIVTEQCHFRLQCTHVKWAGDEIICPSKTYWASCLQAFNLGATVVLQYTSQDIVSIPMI